VLKAKSTREKRKKRRSRSVYGIKNPIREVRWKWSIKIVRLPQAKEDKRKTTHAGNAVLNGR